VLWILEDTNLNNCLRGECFVPGHDNNHSKFTGSYLLLLFVHHACPAHTIQKYTLQVACNGKLVLFCLWNLTTTAPSELPYDLLSGTCYIMANCSYSVSLVHVCGHQDAGAITPCPEKPALMSKQIQWHRPNWSNMFRYNSVDTAICLWRLLFLEWNLGGQKTSMDSL